MLLKLLTNFGSSSQNLCACLKMATYKSRFLSLVMFSTSFLSLAYLVPDFMDGGDHWSCLPFDPPQSTNSVFFALAVVHAVYFALSQLCSFIIFSLTDPEIERHRNNPPQAIS